MSIDGKSEPSVDHKYSLIGQQVLDETKDSLPKPRTIGVVGKTIVRTDQVALQKAKEKEIEDPKQRTIGVVDKTIVRAGADLPDKPVPQIGGKIEKTDLNKVTSKI